jgi:preprotein translocase subunit YajC
MPIVLLLPLVNLLLMIILVAIILRRLYCRRRRRQDNINRVAPNDIAMTEMCQVTKITRLANVLQTDRTPTTSFSRGGSSTAVTLKS